MMNGAELRAAQRTLGLSDPQFARMLGFKSGQHLRAMISEIKGTSDTTARLTAAYLAGYRPADWPFKDENTAFRITELEAQVDELRAMNRILIDAINDVMGEGNPKPDG